MISPSENNRKRGLMSSNEIEEIQIFGLFMKEAPGFQEPGFGTLGTPRAPGDGWRWRKISVFGIKISEWNYSFICCCLCDKGWTGGVFWLCG